MKINLINANTDLGVMVDGTHLAPKILSELIKNNSKIKNIINVDKKEIVKSHNENDLEKNLDYINEFNERLYKEIIASKENGYFPITLGGDHSLAIGSALASIKTDENLGIIWFDSHGDYNTFETTKTGNLHGLPLAACNNLCPKLTGFHKNNFYKPENSVIFGGRDIDPWEMPVINKNNANLITTNEIKNGNVKELVKKAIDLASKNTNGIHISIDTDVIDPEIAPGVSVPAVNGISEETFFEIIKEFLKYKDLIKSIDFVEYNPVNDENDVTKKIVIKALNLIIDEI